MESKNSISQTPEVEWWLPELGGGGNGETLVKGYKCPVIRWIGTEDQMCSAVITVIKALLEIF